MDVQMVWAARWLRVGRVLGAALAPCLMAASIANGGGPDRLTQQIIEAQKAEADRHFDRALDIYGQAMAPGANDQNLRLLLKKRALVFEQIHQPVKAEADFTAALGVEPIDPTLYADRGYFYLRQNRYDKALGDFATGARIDPENPLFLFAEGRVHAAMADFAGAIEHYNDALRVDANYAVAILSRAEAYVHLDRLQEAKRDYDKAIGLKFRREGDRFFAYLGRGYIDILLENFDGAVQDLDQALEAQPSDLNALLFRGYANERRGTSELALRDYERAFAASPDNVWVRASLQRLRSN
jgi:tetratricopeptide (TPR) repeat protein